MYILQSTCINRLSVVATESERLISFNSLSVLHAHLHIM